MDCILSTSHSLDGYRIKKYILPICVRLVDTDLFLYKASGKWDEMWDEKHSSLMEQLQSKASAIGANAVIGIDFEYLRSPGIVTLVATGTAVFVNPL